MEATEKQPDNPNMVAIVVIGAVGAILVYVIFVALQAYFEVEAGRVEAARAAEDIDYQYRTLQTAQDEKMAGMRWVSQDQQTVTLPLDLAMQRVLEDVQRDPHGSLVPAVGAHDTATVPAVFGRPADGAQMPAPAAQDDATATEAPADAEGAAPAEGAAAEGAAPAEEAASGEGAAAATETAQPASNGAEENAPQ